MTSQRSRKSWMFFWAVVTGDDLIDCLHATGRADPAWRALAAAFLRAELHGEAGLARHVDAVVENDDSAMAQHAAGSGHRLVVERRIDERIWKISAERAADLDCADRPAGPRAAAEAFDEFSQSCAKGEFDEPAIANVAGKLERLRSERPSNAIAGIGLRAVLEDPGRGGEAQHIVDDGGLAEQADNRRQGRLDADLPALPLETLQERGFFAADVGASAEPGFEIERLA